MTHWFCWIWLVVAMGFGAASTVEADADPSAEFPRLMGMNIGKKDYNQLEYQADLAKMDIVILGFYKGWQPEKGYTIGKAVRDLQTRNSRLLVGQYTVLNEARDVAGDTANGDVVFKLGTAGWWLRNSAGDRVQWTSAYSAREINFTHWAKPDAKGMRYPQWSAIRNFDVYFRNIPEFRIWYTDNIMHRPRVTADWDGDGVDDNPDDPRILKAWREGYVDLWARIRELSPNILIIGNADSDLSEPEFRGQLDGAFLEGLMGKSWSIENKHGWSTMMRRYHLVRDNLRGPRIVGFNVSGNPKNYQFFRYAFASCLMGDGYFSFTSEDAGYSTVPWFDEYDVKLGRALSPPSQKPWQKTVWRRDFEHGTVLVNPSVQFVEVVIEPGLFRFLGRQDSNVNNGKNAVRVKLSPKDGIVLTRDGRQ